MSDESERLLYVVSAKGSLAWSAFKRVFDELDLREENVGSDDESTGRIRRSKTVRMLDTLGHCDFEFGVKESRVHVAPSVFARLPRSGLPAAVLVGARSPETQKQLEASCAANGCRFMVSSHDSDLNLLPARLLVEADTVDSIHALSQSLGVRFDDRPSAWLIANFAGSLDDYLSAAHWRSEGELNWPRSEFHCNRIAFQSQRSAAATALIRYTNPKRGNVLHLFRSAGRYAEVDCNWGRYAALRDAGLNILSYDERRQFLSVPAGAPLPRLFGRSLGLCSGYAPIFVSKEEAGWGSPESHGFDVFRAIPASIAHVLADKLGQSLVPRPLKAAIR